MKKFILSLVAVLLIQESVVAQFFPIPRPFFIPPGYQPMPVGPTPKIELNSYKLLIAQAIIMGGKELEIPRDPRAKVFFDYWVPALTTVATQLEILDPRENRYVLNQMCDINADLKLLQDRYKELKAAPYLSDHIRFPARTMVNEMMAFNRAYRADLVNRLTLDTIHEGEIRAAITETDMLYRIWDAARDFKCDYYYITVRRQAALSLRTLIGDTAYYSGNLPPYVPIWRMPVYEGP